MEFEHICMMNGRLLMVYYMNTFLCESILIETHDHFEMASKNDEMICK